MRKYLMSALLVVATGCGEERSSSPLDGDASRLGIEATRAWSSVSGRQVCYSVQALGTVGDNLAFPWKMNNSGQIVGWLAPSIDDQTHERAFLWDRGHMTDLGALGDYSVPNDLNARGQVAGYSSAPDGTVHAVFWDDALVDLGIPFGGGLDNFSQAIALNNRGQVVGYSSALPGPGPMHAWLWQEGQLIELESLGGQDVALADINNSGEIVGYSQLANGKYHACVWREGTLTDLGTLNGGTHSVAFAINDSGQILGSSETSSYKLHAVVWDRDGRITDLGVPAGGDSEPRAINQRGEVIGRWFPPDGYDAAHAFVWWHGVMTDFDPTHELYPMAINNRGEIVGYSRGGLGPAWVKTDDGIILLSAGASGAVDINERGQIAGSISSEKGPAAVMWEPITCR